jgi:hypothetical protein
MRLIVQSAKPPSAPAFMRGLAKLPILGNFDWGSPNILPPASFHSATPLASAGGKGCGAHFKQSDKLKFAFENRKMFFSFSRIWYIMIEYTAIPI